MNIWLAGEGERERVKNDWRLWVRESIFVLNDTYKNNVNLVDTFVSLLKSASDSFWKAKENKNSARKEWYGEKNNKFQMHISAHAHTANAQMWQIICVMALNTSRPLDTFNFYWTLAIFFLQCTKTAYNDLKAIFGLSVSSHSLFTSTHTHSHTRVFFGWLVNTFFLCCRLFSYLFHFQLLATDKKK